MARQLTFDERGSIANSLYRRASQTKIAKALRRCPSTISRELQRNGTGREYSAVQAQRRSERRRRERPVARKMADPEINSTVRTGLAQEWAPEQIAGRMKQQGRGRCVSAQTIYAWIKQDRDRDHWQSLLRRRKRRPWRLRSTATAWNATRIRNRPKVIERRLRLGDFEGDTVLGPSGTGGLATLVCRKSRLTIVFKVRSKNANRMLATLTGHLETFDSHLCRSITFDNGGEFARCHRLEEYLGIKVYFADPGRPYQRGTNENTNGLIRHYFPKGTDFRNISHHAVRRVETLLNTRPRACLGFRTPVEVFFEAAPPAGCD
jgi:IS30 family transposase